MPKLHKGQWWFRGEPFSAKAFRSTAIRGCRTWLNEDVLGEPGQGFIRGIWMLELLRTCPRHGVPLEPLWSRYNRFERLDTALRLTKHFQGNAGPSSARMSTSATIYDRWVHGRLSQEKQHSNWLDQFGLQAAAAFYAALGRLIEGRERGAGPGLDPSRP